MKSEFFWIATGGTGGHIFPALAVADELIARKHKVIVSVDVRGKKYVKNYRHTTIWASGVGAKSALFQVFSMFKILMTTLFLTIRFIFSRPDKIVAFGGYSSVPVLIAGRIWNIPTFLHEQNAAIGRANNFAMPFVKTLMTSFPIGQGVYTGLPVRKDFNDKKWLGNKNRILVTGGSLGAAVLDDNVPRAISKIKHKDKLFVVHQTRPENVEKLRKIYAKMNVKNNVTSFIKDMAGELSEASIVISRAGASTVVEMQTVGVPAILVPLWINPDQLANAKAFAKNGGGIVIEQKNFNADFLAENLDKLLSDTEKLNRMAKAALVPNKAISNIMKAVGA